MFNTLTFVTPTLTLSMKLVRRPEVMKTIVILSVFLTLNEIGQMARSHLTNSLSLPNFPPSPPPTLCCQNIRLLKLTQPVVMKTIVILSVFLTLNEIGQMAQSHLPEHSLPPTPLPISLLLSKYQIIEVAITCGHENNCYSLCLSLSPEIIVMVSWT